MHSYIEIAVINALVVIPLALVAALAGRLFRRPVLTHLLWVLVLVKLVTPPIWQIPLIDRDWVTAQSRQILPAIVFEIDRIEFGQQLPGPVNATESFSPSKPRPRTLAARNNRFAANRPTMMAVLLKRVRSEDFPDLVLVSLLLIWSFGSLIWFAVQGFRCIRFRMALGNGAAAGSELQRFADQMARCLGLSHSPTVWLMPGVMSPMLWGTGQSALLIFPEQLLDRLDMDATGTLLTHEISHFRRRDHWVRIVALMATGFFWWHPVVWWARREIEAVEEECCDALVVKAAAAPAKRYAEAILEAVDFLAESRLRLPPLATGLGQVPFLRQRLTWIMRGPRRQDIGYCGKLLCLSLACTLPFQPSWLAAHTSTPLPARLPATPAGRIEATPVLVPPTTSGAETGLVQTPAESSLKQYESVAATSKRRFEVQSHSSDGRYAVLGNKTAQSLLDLETGREFDLNDYGILAMAFAPNTHRFVTVGIDSVLRVWNAETTEVEKAWNIPVAAAKSVDISPNADWIATGGRDGIVRIWVAESAEPICEFPRELAPVNCVRISPDGQLLAVATGDWMTPQSGRIALIETAQWTERISMNWNSPSAAVAFRADGQSLMSGDWQGRIARWSLSTGELLGLSDGYKDLIPAAEFSPNGSTLAEIEVTDLRPDGSWNDAPPTRSLGWLFGRWSQKQPESPRPSFGPMGPTSTSPAQLPTP